MSGITLNSRLFESYLQLLAHLDNKTKKKLIESLKKSLSSKKEPQNISSLFGAWEDSRSADEIIDDLRRDRVEKAENEEF